jgi:hypothetical protein
LIKNLLSSAAPLVTSAIEEEDIICETDRWVSWGGLIDLLSNLHWRKVT